MIEVQGGLRRGGQIDGGGAEPDVGFAEEVAIVGINIGGDAVGRAGGGGGTLVGWRPDFPNRRASIPGIDAGGPACRKGCGGIKVLREDGLRGSGEFLDAEVALGIGGTSDGEGVLRRGGLEVLVAVPDGPAGRVGQIGATAEIVESSELAVPGEEEVPRLVAGLTT